MVIVVMTNHTQRRRKTMSEQTYYPDTEPQDIPDNLKVPDGEVLLLRAYGKGVQIYGCPAVAAGAPGSPGAFTGPVPHAILLKGDKDEGDLVVIHFAGPTWQALDGSKVVGEKVASAPAPDADGVDWLLLKAKSTEGSGLMSRVTHIHRLYTDGGKPPVAGCDHANNQTQVLVEYSAQYLFYGAPTQNQ